MNDGLIEVRCRLDGDVRQSTSLKDGNGRGDHAKDGEPFVVMVASIGQPFVGVCCSCGTLGHVFFTIEYSR